MLDTSREELAGVLNLYKKDLEKFQTKKREELLARQKFDMEFKRLKQEVIWPVIVDIGNYLTNFGHDFQVSQQEEHTDATARYYPESITFNIYPSSLKANYRRPESAPYVSFVANRYAKKVVIVVSTMMPGQGGVIGEHGSYDAAKITADFVEHELVTVLKNTFILHDQD